MLSSRRQWGPGSPQTMEKFLAQFSLLVDLIYDAAIDPKAWPLFLTALSKSFECASGLLHRYDATVGMAPVFNDFGHDVRFIQSYAEHYARINPYPAESFARLPLGKVDHASALLSPDTIVGTEFYNDWMKPQGISPNHLGVVLDRSANSMALLCVAPQAKVFDDNPRSFAERLQLLVPHLRKALQINRTLGASQFATVSSNAMIDKIPAAVFLLYGTGKLMFANAKGDTMLRNERVVAIDAVTRKLRAHYQKECTRLEAAIEAAKSTGQPQIFRMVAAEAGTAHIITVFPLGIRQPKDCA